MRSKRPDYLPPYRFGSLELRAGVAVEFVGLPVDDAGPMTEVRALTPAADRSARIDDAGMDLEELDVPRTLIGAQHPVTIIEQSHVVGRRLGELPARRCYQYFRPTSALRRRWCTIPANIRENNHDRRSAHLQMQTEQDE
jgi:hypothetical protein